MIRRISLGLVLGVGLFWLVSTIALGYPAKTAAVDNLTGAFRPVFSDTGLKQSSDDIATINAFASEFQTKAVPAIAKQLHMTPDQLVSAVSKQYPDVGAGLHQLPTSLPYFNGMVDGLHKEQADFQKADAIPTSTLPAKTVNILFIVLGIVTIGVAGFGFTNANKAVAALTAAAILGIAVIGVTVVLSVPSKAKAVDGLTGAFRPVFTDEGAAQTRDYLTTVEKMNTQLTQEAVPGLAKMLGVTPDQFASSLSTQFPAVGAGLQQMQSILHRFDALVTKIENNVKNFQRSDSIPTTSAPTTTLEGQLLYPSLALILAGCAGVVLLRRERTAHVLEVHRREGLEPAGL